MRLERAAADDRRDRAVEELGEAAGVLAVGVAAHRRLDDLDDLAAGVDEADELGADERLQRLRDGPAVAEVASGLDPARRRVRARHRRLQPQVYRVDVDARTYEQVGRAPGFVLGVAADGRGRLALCVSQRRPSICVWDGSDARVVAEGLTFPNHAAFGPDGTLWFSDSGRWAQGDGRVHRLAADGSLEELTRALPDFPNGCAVSDDGRTLWVVQSYDPTVSRIDLETGAVDHVARLEGTVPDGLALTDDGGVLVACYRPDRIYHLGADGSPRGRRGRLPGNAAGRTDERLLRRPGARPRRLGEPRRRHLTLLDLGLRGAPLHRPETWAADA